jgi:transglutaminase-like putative cysteine protease
LERGAGTCRDYAFLMMEAVRSLGFGARFVTGYLYDPKLDSGGDAGTVGAGATHAWCEIYLPGAGWVEYDPTNAIIGGEALIRVAVTRDPSQASPIAGSYDGEPGDYLGMKIEVTVTSRETDLTPAMAAE